jgi:membrane protein
MPSHSCMRLGTKRLKRTWSGPWWTRTRQLSVIVYNELFRTRAFTMAAAMSYYFLLALLPLLIFFSALLGYLPIPRLFDQLLDILAVVVPPQAMQMVERILAGLLIPHRGGLLSFGFLGYLWSASGGFSALIDALNVAYDVEKSRPYWRDRLQALLLTFTTGFLVMLGLLLIIAGPHFGHFLTELFPVPKEFAVIWPPLRLVTIFVIFVVSIELQYYLAPNRKQRFRNTLPGALVAVSGIFLGSFGMAYYFAHLSNYNKMYGSLGAVIILMVWFYVMALFFVAGAELNAELLKIKAQKEPARITEQLPAKEMPKTA